MTLQPYPIYFFIPATLWPETMPSSPDENWSGYGLGIYAWTVQTYLRLRAAGLSCELTSELPPSGIVLCHSNALRSVKAAANAERFVICMKAEAPLSAIALMHVVQNPSEISLSKDCYFIPHWPQPQLIPRNAARGDQFKTVVFYGHQDSLASELRSHAWQVALSERGLEGRTISNTNRWDDHSAVDTGWNDYHDVDGVVAVRSFNPWHRLVTGGFSNKPATKLYNAWLSGVIPILGAESAYRQTGTPGEDYLEVGSFSDLLSSLDRLKEDLTLRQQLIANGQIKSGKYTPEGIVTKWQNFLELVAIPAYIRWRQLPEWQQKQALVSAKLNSYLNKVNRRGQRLLLFSGSG
ncbi:MAG: hypothetical protein AAFS04_06100 [Cyanobacteria bacterium J06631_9]